MIIQWYPGHMNKTKKLIQENISLVDVVIELVDARIPLSSKNPDIDKLANNKFRIIILNKSDLADADVNKKWINYFEKLGMRVILTNSINGQGIDKIYQVSRDMMKEKIERLRQRGRIFVPTRAMIVGIPNVGKSTLINKCVGKGITKTGDRPGVTTAKQWIKLRKDFELLDTPGILWPKFEDEEVGLKLAFTGAIKDEILDTSTLAIKLVEYLNIIDPLFLKKRYGISFDLEDESFKILEKIAEARGFKQRGNILDIERTANILLDEFRGSKLGKITLESPQNT